MKLSFIIPALNEEKIIGKCVSFITPQLSTGDEVIVVDNGCSDRTVKIAKVLGAKVVPESKKGISHARNKGASVAAGDILCFIDADGVVSEDWVKQAKKGFASREVQAVVGLNVFTHERPAKYLLYNSYTVISHSGLFLYKMIAGKTFLTGNNLAIRKSAFDKLGGFDPVVAEDAWLSKKFWKLKHKKAVFNPKMVVKYSSRGFDAAGYYKTINLWIKSALKPVSQDNYNFENKEV
jgi:glycosyltransferase involved in cell wall biosynthesis